MKTILTTILIFISGCTHTIPEKPWVITRKTTDHTYHSGSPYEYQYVSKDGESYFFYETADKYEIGDTIK